MKFFVFFLSILVVFGGAVAVARRVAVDGCGRHCRHRPPARHLERRAAAAEDDGDGLVSNALMVYFTDKLLPSEAELERRLRRRAAATAAATQRRQRLDTDGARLRATSASLPPFGSIIYDKYDLPVDKLYIRQVLEVCGDGCSERTRMRWLNALSVGVEIDDDSNGEEKMEQIVQRISSLPSVRSINNVRLLKTAVDVVECDATPVRDDAARELSSKRSLQSLYSTTSNDERRLYGESLAQVTFSDVLEAHRGGVTGAGVRVGIMDSGFFLDHLSLKNMKLAAQFDFVRNQTSVDGSHKDNWHGTATLSTLAGYLPSQLIGAAYNATYYVARTENINYEKRIEEDFFIAGVEWEEAAGVDVLSMSLGYKDWYHFSDFDGKKSPISRQIERAQELGVFCVVASGNEGAHGIGAPADARRVLTVGAIDGAGRHASYSSIGPSADGRLKPDVVALGSKVVCADSSHPKHTRYGTGTSYACPLAAGVAALVKQAKPHWTAAMIHEAMVEAARLPAAAAAAGGARPDLVFGFGVVNYTATIAQNPRTHCAQGGTLKCYNGGICDKKTAAFCRCSGDDDGSGGGGGGNRWYGRDCSFLADGVHKEAGGKYVFERNRGGKGGGEGGDVERVVSDGVRRLAAGSASSLPSFLHPFDAHALGNRIRPTTSGDDGGGWLHMSHASARLPYALLVGGVVSAVAVVTWVRKRRQLAAVVRDDGGA